MSALPLSGLQATLTQHWAQLALLIQLPEPRELPTTEEALLQALLASPPLCVALCAVLGRTRAMRCMTSGMREAEEAEGGEMYNLTEELHMLELEDGGEDVEGGLTAPLEAYIQHLPPHPNLESQAPVPVPLPEPEPERLLEPEQ
ncbi:hypothetical protein B484DRAFT_410457 [Ochromonadaceae sp. CCMP2298]|nr:hypothetical protein B484DRAFT_410457 [Ochromonadaceae sp. CCMP2298]